MKQPNIVAHRGGAALFNENTMPAFEHALALGVDEIECDVHLLKDGQVAVFHDFDLEQLTGQSGHIAKLDRAQFNALRVGDATTAPPLLEDLAQWLSGNDMGLHLEIKVSGDEERENMLSQTTLAILQNYGLLGKTSVISFGEACLKPFAAQGVPCGPCVDRPDAFVDHDSEKKLIYWKELGFKDLSLNSHHSPISFIEKAKALDFNVGVWTVNGPARLSYWLKQNIDYITTDQPDLALAMRARHFYKR